MTVTPAVGVSAGRTQGSVTSQPRGWSSVLRSVLLVPAVIVAIAAVFVVPARPAQAGVASSLDLRATYEVNANLNWKQGTLFVSSVAHVTNTRSDAVGQLVFNALPTQLGHMNLIGASAGGVEADATVHGQSIIVQLPENLAPGDERGVRIDYKATFNTNTGGKKSLFMKKNGTAAAYRWIPWLSRDQRYSTPNFGETWVTAVSPRVDVTITSDVALTYATSGWKTGGKGGKAQSFAATDVRDFNFSASPSYDVKTIEWRGVEVQLFTRAYDPDRLWYWAKLALNRFSDKIGMYPYRHFSIAETPAGVGMESPGMVWVDATLEKSRFPYIVVHETSHEWFYGVIGNNQGTDPFVDESMGDFLTRDAIDAFRKPGCGEMPLDRPTWGYSGGCYNEAIYVQGGLYIRNYRDTVGAANFWDAMSALWQAKKFDIVSTQQLWNFLDEHTGFKGSHRERFPSLY